MKTPDAAKLLQFCLSLCDPIDSSPPGSSVPGILQARTLEWGAIAFSLDASMLLQMEFSLSFYGWLIWNWCKKICFPNYYFISLETKNRLVSSVPPPFYFYRFAFSFYTQLWKNCSPHLATSLELFFNNCIENPAPFWIFSMHLG